MAYQERKNKGGKIMNIIVTGGAGFIGSHLCEKLLSLNHRVVNIDNFNDFYDFKIKIRNVLESINSKELIRDFQSVAESTKIKKDELIKALCDIAESKKYKICYGDIRDDEFLEKIFSDENPDVVINLAGMAGVRPSLSKPLLYEDVNVRGTMNILEMCRKYNVKKFIQASSSSVYGNNKKVPFKETDVVDFPISPYAATKKSCEVIGHVYHTLYKTDMFQLRFFTVYGERQRPDLAVHKFTKLILDEKPVSVYGDGNSFRDYTYIDDIIQGILKSMDYLLKNSNVYEILNLGNSHTISLNEMIKTIENELGKKAEIKNFPLQQGDVNKTYADISKAENLIGYSPKTDFGEGIKKFVKWYKQENFKK